MIYGVAKVDLHSPCKYKCCVPIKVCSVSLYNLNTEVETLIPSLKAIGYNKMHHEGGAIRIDNKDF